MSALSVPISSKAALEELLRERRLHVELPPLRGEGLRRSLLPTGLSALDSLLAGGVPRGQLSEVYGPASSGRSGVLLALLARTTCSGALCALVDPSDAFDPASAAEAGADLERLLWLRGLPRGRGFAEVLAVVGTLVGSGLFDMVALDLAGVPATEMRRLPQASFVRLQRLVEDGTTALLLVASRHTATSPRGVTLAMRRIAPWWSGQPGPGRLFRGLRCEATAGRHAQQQAAFDLHAL